MKILVTGSTGMVGRHLLFELHSKKISYIATSVRPASFSMTGKWIKWDFCDDDFALDSIFQDVTAIFHMAGLVPVSYNNNPQENLLFDINTRSTMTLAKWAYMKQIPLIYLSSASVYSNPYKKIIREDDSTFYSELGGFYSCSKFLAEKILEYYANIGLQLIVFRPASIYGYGLPPSKMMMRFINTALQDGEILLSSPIEDEINLIHATDIIKAMIAALEKQAWGVYNLAFTQTYSILEIARSCVKVIKKGRVVVQGNQPISVPKITFNLEIDKARKSFDFSPAIDLCTGIEMILDKSAVAI